MHRIAAAAAFACLVSTGATAQDAAGAAPPPADDVMVIEGARSREQMLDFVVEIADPVSPGNGYARWGRRLCIGVQNLSEEPAQYVIDRISLAALDVGLQPQGPGCRPNVDIIFSRDATALATRLVDESPTVFRPFGGLRGTTQGLAALKAFKTSDAPVRWWQITMEVDWTGDPANTLPQDEAILGGPRMVRGANSLITNSVKDELWGVYIIVDAGKVGDATWPQLTDYLAMVALAQIDPEASPTGHDTILNLFTAKSPPPGMTEWDRSFLAALYELDTRLMPRLQRGALVSEMMREREAE